MQGGIYTRVRCAQCREGLHYHNSRFFECKDGHRQIPSSFIVKFPGGIFRSFTDFDTAEQYLNHIRVEKRVRGRRFNPDDYRGAKPNSFAVLSQKYLERKKNLQSYGKIRHDIDKALAYFGDVNVREISGGMIDDYLFGLVQDNGKPMSDKTRANHASRLHDFWKWCLDRGDVLTLAEFPTFPKISYELAYRKITTWKIQEQIIEKVKEMTYAQNPKIWFGIDMLSTYTALRPDDLRRVREDSLDDVGWLTIFNPTKRKNKFKRVHLHNDHVRLWNAYLREFPSVGRDLPFFRHHGRVRGTTRTEIVFGENMFYLSWAKACQELGITGVPLYPGTKHTTASETAKLLGTDRARAATGLTNKASERYILTENSDAFEVVTEIRRAKKGEVVPFKKSVTPSDK